MQRRTVIKQLVCYTSAAILLPSCLQDTGKASILLKKIAISSDQEKLLAELSETIIPATETPGAKDLSAHLFALMMIDDCYTKEDQQKFITGLKAFEAHTKHQFNRPFVKCSDEEKQSILRDLESKSGNQALDFFYAKSKSLTIQAYTTSQFFLTKVHVYELIPGRYQGCVPVKSNI